MKSHEFIVESVPRGSNNSKCGSCGGTGVFTQDQLKYKCTVCDGTGKKKVKEDDDENPFARAPGQARTKFQSVPVHAPSKLQTLCKQNNIAVRDQVLNKDKQNCEILQIGEKGFQVHNYTNGDKEWYLPKDLFKDVYKQGLVPILGKQ